MDFPYIMRDWLMETLGGIPGVLITLAAAVSLLVFIRLWRRVRRWLRRRGPARLNPKLAKYGGDTASWAADQRRGQAELIVATSSTSEISGYEVVEQLEAVYVDGFRRPEEATEGLKSTAAAKGANAVINVQYESAGMGRHAARGDAVVIRRLARSVSPGTPPHQQPGMQPPETPGHTPHQPPASSQRPHLPDGVPPMLDAEDIDRD